MRRAAYSFRRIGADDLPLLRRWLRTPEVRRWWGDPEQEAAMIERDLPNPRIDMEIVAFEGRDFAYAQSYGVHVWPQAFLAGLPSAAKAIDAFVGEPDMIGVGHGSAFLRLLAERLCAEGAPLVVIDPATDNFRARRAYEKAGFAGDQIVEAVEGPAVLMIFDPAAKR